MNKNWLSELKPYLTKKYKREDFTEPEITAAVSVLRGLTSNETLNRAWRFLIKMRIITDIGGGRFFFDKMVLKDFTGGPTKKKKRRLKNG